MELNPPSPEDRLYLVNNQNVVKEILKDLPDENAMDPAVVTRLKQYQLKYVEKTYNPEESFFSAEI